MKKQRGKLRSNHLVFRGESVGFSLNDEKSRTSLIDKSFVRHHVKKFMKRRVGSAIEKGRIYKNRM